MAQRQIGPYVIEQRLAAGGMAEVFVAKRTGPHGFFKRVALKRILPQFGQDPDFVAMFIDEARLAAQLEHPNIVQVFDFGEHGKNLFLAMELVDGTNVNRLLRAVAGRGETVPVEVALQVVLEAARALSYAHQACDEHGALLGIVHRDVSPANLLLTRNGHVKLSDFGIACLATAERRTDEGQIRGKLGYMSPEQVLGKELDGRSDIFTLGTVLAEMLIAEPLFGRGRELDVLLRIRDADLRVLDNTSRKIPKDVKQLLHATLVRNPEKRPAASVFADAVEQLLRNRTESLSGAEGVSKVLQRFDLVPPPSADVLALEAPSTPTGLVSLANDAQRGNEFEESTGVTESLSETLEASSPAVYQIRLENGAELGPLGFPKLVELFTTASIDGKTLISKTSGAYVEAAKLPELARFVTSAALQWGGTEGRSHTWSGPLGHASLLPVVHRIWMQRETGVLELSDVTAGQPTRRKKIYFVTGRPEFIASTDREELLGEYLVRSGRCLPMEIEMALALLPKFSGRLGDALVGLNVLRSVELFRAIAGQIRERYLEAFRWTSGEWTYLRGEVSDEETFPLGEDPQLLMRDALQVTDIEELQAALKPYRRELVTQSHNPAAILDSYGFPTAWNEVIRSVDGRETLNEVLQRATTNGMEEDDVYRALYAAVAMGHIEQAVEPTLVESHVDSSARSGA